MATFLKWSRSQLTLIQQGQMNMIALLIFGLLALAVVAGICFIERAAPYPVNSFPKAIPLNKEKIYAHQQSHLPLKLIWQGHIQRFFLPVHYLFISASLGFRWWVITLIPIFSKLFARIWRQVFIHRVSRWHVGESCSTGCLAFGLLPDVGVLVHKKYQEEFESKIGDDIFQIDASDGLQTQRLFGSCMSNQLSLCWCDL